MASRFAPALFVFAAVLSWLPTSSALAQRLHALVVADTVSPGIGQPVSRSIDALITVFRENLPENKLSLTLLAGEEFTRARVFEAIRSIEADGDDAILFYYCGHGYYDRQEGTSFKIPGEERRLLLSDIRKPLREKNPRLLMSICDCCSGRAERSYAAATVREPLRPEDTSPLFRSLFWESSGNLVVNSCSPGQYATIRLTGGEAGEPGIGALFTNIFIGALRKHQDRSRTWEAIIGECRTSVDREFRRLHPEGTIRLGPDRVVEQASQTVWGLKNGEYWFRPPGR